VDNKNNLRDKDHPEQVKTDNKSMHDRFEEEQNVDAIPLEDLKIEQREEKDKHKTKNNSGSEEKYPD